MEWYTGVLKKYAEFNGRAGRQEFWMFVAIHVGIFVVLAIIDAVIGLNNVLVGLYWLATIVPVIAVGIRRLHDIGKPGIWILLGLIPCVGLYLLFLCAQESVGPNEYGEGPSAAAA